MRIWKDWLAGGLTLCFSWHLPFPAFATTIVAILEETSITLAADGITTGKSNKTGKPFHSAVCKIQCFDRLCFTAAGRYAAKTIKYNLPELVNTVLDRPRTLIEASERFKAVLTPLIPKIVAVAKKETPDMYAKWLKGKPMLAYLFAGFDNNSKSSIIRGLVKIDSEGKTLPIEELTRRGESGLPDIMSYGNNEHVANYLERHADWRSAAASNPVEFTERMIRLEIQAAEKEGWGDVGEPISVMSLTKKERHFKVERAGNCR